MAEIDRRPPPGCRTCPEKPAETVAAGPRGRGAQPVSLASACRDREEASQGSRRKPVVDRKRGPKGPPALLPFPGSVYLLRSGGTVSERPIAHKRYPRCQQHCLPVSTFIQRTVRIAYDPETARGAPPPHACQDDPCSKTYTPVRYFRIKCRTNMWGRTLARFNGVLCA